MRADVSVCPAEKKKKKSKTHKGQWDLLICLLGGGLILGASTARVWASSNHPSRLQTASVVSFRIIAIKWDTSKRPATFGRPGCFLFPLLEVGFHLKSTTLFQEWKCAGASQASLQSPPIVSFGHPTSSIGSGWSERLKSPHFQPEPWTSTSFGGHRDHVPLI